MWTFNWYDNGEVACPWQSWYDRQDGSVQGRHDNVFDFLEVRNNNEWKEPYSKYIEDGIVEIRIFGKVQHRFLGYFVPGKRHQFNIVLSCTHKGRVYQPKDWLKTAKKRRDEIESGQKNAKPRTRPS